MSAHLSAHAKATPVKPVASANKGSKSAGSIQVIERMMSLLDALAAVPDTASLKQLASATDLHPSTKRA